MNTDTARVQPDSLVTLHYRIRLKNGQPLIDTFAATPATLQLGRGELLPALEKLLIGLCEGESCEHRLAPEDAFGAHRAELIERVERRHLPPDAVEAMSILEFTAPDGSRYPGLLTELHEDHALIDFNHPLAGKTIRFEATIIGITNTSQP